MGAGGWLLGRIVESRPRPERLYAVLEFGVAILSTLAFLLIPVTGRALACVFLPLTAFRWAARFQH